MAGYQYKGNEPDASVDKCGTYPGYRQHKRDNTPVCEPCQGANTEYMADYRARKAA